MIAWVVVGSALVFAAAYRFYGRFLARQVGLDNRRQTPACAINDGVDYVPAKPGMLLGQHFSAIAAAGPIVGPILAGVLFGWVPALLWIVLGSIFVGGVHDFASLVASVRHRASSIGEVIRLNMSRTSHILFLVFVWVCLIYVIIAFTDITAGTFKTFDQGQAYGPAVAGSSILYLLIGVTMGVALYKFKAPVWIATLVGLPLVLLAVWAGPHLPAGILQALGSVSAKQWDVYLLLYCFAASVIPMWLLLQPRGYLGGWMLYLVMAVGLLGALLGGFAVQYPALNFKPGTLDSLRDGSALLPVLFITVACGACSGFHGVVSSGTTSRQLAKESHARPVGYGGMLLEGLVAVLALATVMMLPKSSPQLQGAAFNPTSVFSEGIARYISLAGIPFTLGKGFALLAFSTFVYDTLDVCTRLARYILQELLGWKTRLGGFIATFLTLLLPLGFLMVNKENAWRVAWPIFGTSNQLLASLILLAVAIWLSAEGRRVVYVLVPMFFMLAMTLLSLGQHALRLANSFSPGGPPRTPEVLTGGVVSIILLAPSLFLVAEAMKILLFRRPAAQVQPAPVETEET